MRRTARRHERELLDTLEAIGSKPFEGEVWRTCIRGRNPLQGSTAPGRWNAAGEMEVLYTSLEQDGALAEIGFRLSQEPVWPSRLEHDLYRLSVKTEKSLHIDSLPALARLGVDVARYASFDYGQTQAIAAAARFLEFDSLIVPSARSPATHLVLILDTLADIDGLRVLDSTPVDWVAWRGRR